MDCAPPTKTRVAFWQVCLIRKVKTPAPVGPYYARTFVLIPPSFLGFGLLLDAIFFSGSLFFTEKKTTGTDKGTSLH